MRTITTWGAWAFLLLTSAPPLAAADWTWWPDQKMARGLVEVTQEGYSHSKSVTLQTETENMLVASLAGLAAQAVNEGRFDELVWNDFNEPETYHQWLDAFRARTRIENRGVFSPWDLAARYTKAGLVKGYILCDYDLSAAKKNAGKLRGGGNTSANAATTAAGVLQGMIITPEMEPRARSLGLKLLLDARGKDEMWAYDHFKDRLDCRYLLLMDPLYASVRDLAIAHRVPVLFATKPAPGSRFPEVLDAMKPGGSVWGWGGGGELETVRQISRAGHILVGELSNWSMNLPVLSAGRSELEQAPLKQAPDAARIRKESASPCTSFLSTDGDNFQWIACNFFGPRYWNNPDRDKVPFGWTLCPGDVYQMAPDIFAHLRKTQPVSSTLVGWPGYFNPDLFGQDYDAKTREARLRAWSRQIAGMMNATGCRILTFLAADDRTEETRAACRIFAEEIPGLAGAFLIGEPYESGAGQIIWAPGRDGHDVPFITAHYAIRAHLGPKFPLAGTPAQVARLINADAAAEMQKGGSYAAWVTLHAWSGFLPGPEGDTAGVKSSVAGDNPGVTYSVSTAARCASHFSPGIEVVSPEDLVWITRYRHDPQGTEALWQKAP